MDNYAIEVNLSTRSFSISGDRAFVQSHYQELANLVQQAAPNPLSASQPSDVSGAPDSAATEPQRQSAHSADATRYIEYGIYYIDDETGLPVIQAAVPGDNMREKMKNVAFILLFATRNAPLSASYLKEQCRRQSCLDANNFSKAFEKDRRNFIKKGRAGSREWTLELTVPGHKAASDLLANICPEE